MRSLVASCSGVDRVITLVLLLGALVGFAYWASIPGGDLLTANLSEPLNGVTTAKIDINTGSGNLAIGRLDVGQQLLATGTLEYFENQGLPVRNLSSDNGQASLIVRGGDTGQSGFRLPWTGCNGTTEWRVQLNPNVRSNIVAHSGGGNVRLALAGMTISSVSADTGGGNVDVVLPDAASGLNVKATTGAGNVAVDVGGNIAGSNTVNASSGAGNVSVRVPNGTVARIHATSGVGKVTVDQRFSQMNGNTYQSPDYDRAASKVELTVHSGAGNVNVDTK